MDDYSIYMGVYSLILISSIGFGAGKNRKLVIFKDYDDLGLTFLLPLSVTLILVVLTWMEVSVEITQLVAGITALPLLLKLIVNTYRNNGGSIIKTILSINAKLPLAVLWVLSLYQSLNPSGSNARQRRSNRGVAMVILAIVTPIIGLLVVEKEGSIFNPRQWIRGRRMGSSIRSNM